MSDKTVWGIDLGTTYSCVARVDQHGYASVVPDSAGEMITPSVVLFESAEEAVVGKAAKDQMQMSPELVCELVKQQMGEPDWRFDVHDKQYSAAEVSGLILRELAAAAEAVTGTPVEDVVITVPAYFGITERSATEAAGEMAGLNVLNVLSEPTAAAFSYGFAQGAQTDETILVYDLGGGTFDVTVIRLEPSPEGTGTSIRVVATGGNDRLGGALWDQRLATLLADKFAEAKPDAGDPMDDPVALADLRVNAENVKRTLSSADSHRELMLVGTDRANVTVTRTEFEEATSDLLAQTIEFTAQTVEDAKALGAPTIDRVLLVGGSSFMPAVREAIVQRFPDWNPELTDPNQAVAKGAALAGLGDLAKKVVTGGEPSGESSGPPDEEAVKTFAATMNLSKDVAEKLVTTSFQNVCARGFGVKVLRSDAPDRETQLDEDYVVDHIIKPQTPLPVSVDQEGQTETYYTRVEGQPFVVLEIWEQNSPQPSGDVRSNKWVDETTLHLGGHHPLGTAIRVSLGMDNAGQMLLRAVAPDGSEARLEASGSGAVITQEQIDEGTAKIQSLRRGSD